ncbi:MAG: bifunctional 2',3'-cyclic-nucleotide 2'-phosphodiesterase/3'-nucleotidase [Ruegeria sp.]
MINKFIDHSQIVSLRVLATSDLHMNLTSFDYYADRPDPTVGFTRTASLIRDARVEAEASGAPVLLFDYGDEIQGTPLGEWAAENRIEPHPVVRAFYMLGYDAIGLGNHEFSFGLETLDRILAGANCPVIRSNAKHVSQPQRWQSGTVLTRSLKLGEQSVPVRIGVLSVLPPQTAIWESHKIRGQIVIDDIVISAQRAAEDLKRRGSDLVIALAHSGLGKSHAEPGAENAVIALAGLDDIDAIIAGHTHMLLPDRDHAGSEHVDFRSGLIRGKPVVMPGSAGSHLGVIDLRLKRNGPDGWTLIGQEVELRSIYHSDSKLGFVATHEDARLKRLFEMGHKETRARIAKPMGRVSQPLHSYFSFCAQDRGLGLIAAAQAATLRPIIANSALAGLPILSVTSSSKTGGRSGPGHFTDVPAGEISVRHVADLHVFPNELRAVIATGAQIKEWLEMSAGVFHHLTPNTESELVDPAWAGYNFDVFHGLTYELNPSQPSRYDAEGRLINPGTRVNNLAFNGHPISDASPFIVALNSYRACGGGHFSAVTSAHQIDLPPLKIHDILCDYLSGKIAKDPLECAPRPWTFAALSGQTVVLRTGPDAARYLHELAEYDPVVMGNDPDGFLNIRLTL